MAALIAVGALIVAVVQALMFWRQLGMMKKTLADSTKAARAAEAAAQATANAVEQSKRDFIAANRPILKMRQIQLVTIAGSPSSLNYTLANVGQSKATVVESNITLWIHGKGEEWPGRPPYNTTKDALGALMIEAGQDHLGTYSPPDNDWALLLGDVAKDKLDTMLLGYVSYLDEIGVQRRVGFCRRRTEGGLRFEACGGEDYEYFY